MLRRSLEVDLDPLSISIPRAIEFPTGDGAVAHAELKLGDAYIMLGEHRDANADLAYGGSTTYVVIDDPDAHHARAVAAGADIVRPLTDQHYGSREYAAKDPAGNVWSFGTYLPS